MRLVLFGLVFSCVMTFTASESVVAHSWDEIANQVSQMETEHPSSMQEAMEEAETARRSVIQAVHDEEAMQGDKGINRADEVWHSLWHSPHSDTSHRTPLSKTKKAAATTERGTRSSTAKKAKAAAKANKAKAAAKANEAKAAAKKAAAKAAKRVVSTTRFVLHMPINKAKWPKTKASIERAMAKKLRVPMARIKAQFKSHASAYVTLRSFMDVSDQKGDSEVDFAVQDIKTAKDGADALAEKEEEKEAERAMVSRLRALASGRMKIAGIKVPKQKLVSNVPQNTNMAYEAQDMHVHKMKKHKLHNKVPASHDDARDPTALPKHDPTAPEPEDVTEIAENDDPTKHDPTAPEPEGVKEIAENDDPTAEDDSKEGDAGRGDPTEPAKMARREHKTKKHKAQEAHEESRSEDHDATEEETISATPPQRHRTGAAVVLQRSAMEQLENLSKYLTKAEKTFHSGIGETASVASRHSSAHWSTEPVRAQVQEHLEEELPGQGASHLGN